MNIRAKKPEAKDLEGLSLPNPKKVKIKNIPIYTLENNDTQIIKFYLTFESGRWFEDTIGASYFASKMLKAGTSNMNYHQIAEEIDFYGATMDIISGTDHTLIQITSLKKFFPKMITLLSELISNSNFPSSYLELEKDLYINKLLIQEKQNDIRAYKFLSQSVFGKNHPYGKIISKEEILSIKLQDVIPFFKDNLFTNPKIYLSSEYDTGELEGLVDTISKHHTPRNISHHIESSDISYKENIEDNLQASITIGKIFPKKTHQDYMDLSIICELLGGYFGSRLMLKIREEKGYTYGIHSFIQDMQHSSLFCISTDVHKMYENETCDEIYNEIRKLKEVPIGSDELASFQSHMKGKIQLSLDGPISIMDRFIKIDSFDLSLNYYSQLFDKIMFIDSDRILELSNKYLNDFHQVIIG